jgi:DNA-binding transcriptional regulator YbjK
MDIKSIFSITTAITSSNDSIADKVTQLNQNYAQFKLNDGRLLTLRREKHKKVSQALVLRDKRIGEVE